jgi:hypothetical protein
MLTSYALAKRKPRPLRKLYLRREEMMSKLKREADKVYLQKK